MLKCVFFFCVCVGLRGNRKAGTENAARADISEATPYMHGLS